MLISEVVVRIGEMNCGKRTPAQVRGLSVLGPLYSCCTCSALLPHSMQSRGKLLLPVDTAAYDYKNFTRSCRQLQQAVTET